MGPLKNILGMIPGMSQAMPAGAEIDEKALVHTEAIIQSMTKAERLNPSILNGSRKRRIAAGSGRTIQEVNRLVKQFEDMRKMMKNISGGGMFGKKGKFGKKGAFPFF